MRQEDIEIEYTKDIIIFSIYYNVRLPLIIIGNIFVVWNFSTGAYNFAGITPFSTYYRQYRYMAVTTL